MSMTIGDLLTNVQTRIISDYPKHTVVFAEGWFAAVELCKQSALSSDVWPIMMLYAQLDAIVYLADGGKLDEEYANGFREFCRVVAAFLVGK